MEAHIPRSRPSHRSRLGLPRLRRTRAGDALPAHDGPASGHEHGLYDSDGGEVLVSVFICLALVQMAPRLGLSGFRQHYGICIVSDHPPRYYRRDIKSSLGNSNRTRIESILLILVESGFVYCGLWVRI